MVAFRLCLALVLLSSPVWSQTNRYMVFFNDKIGTPHSINQPSTFLSDRALQRRAKAMVAVATPEDLPVTPSYVTQIRATGAKAFFTTRWMNGVLIEATPTIVVTITALPFVSSVEYVAPNQRLLGGRKGRVLNPGNVSASTDNQLRMLGLDSMHQDGFEGEGVIIAVLDSGFPGVESTMPFQAIRDGSQIKLTTDFITNSTNVYQFDDHGTRVFSVIAAETTAYQGAATKANYLLFVTEDVPTEYRVEEYNWLFAAERADSAGADIIQSSLGYNEFDDPAMDYSTSQLNGNTAVVSKAAKYAQQRGIIVVVSAGNLGSTPWQLITSPADVNGILAVGAVSFNGTKAAFSSIGPNAIGTIKPDVADPGLDVSVITSTGQSETESGTSVATPLVTSLVAGLIQAYPQMRPDDIIRSIRWSSSMASNPNNEIGFGIPSYLAVKNYLDRSGYIINAYPNPATSTFWVSMAYVPIDPVEIIIYDCLGKLVLEAKVPITWENNPLPINVSVLGAGVYILRITISQPNGYVGLNTFRFVKY